MSAVSVSSDLRGRFGPARDQGERATCLAFAVSDAHAAVRSDSWEPLSCEYLFYQAKRRDPLPADAGTTLPAIRGALLEEGQPVEADWAYMNSLPAGTFSWSPPVKIGTLFRRKSESHGVLFEQVWEAIEAGKPVIMGMNLSEAFYSPDSAGVIDTSESGSMQMGHAVVATATGTRSGQRFFLVRNSWGESWGMSGSAWLSERYVAGRISAAITLL